MCSQTQATQRALRGGLLRLSGTRLSLASRARLAALLLLALLCARPDLARGLDLAGPDPFLAPARGATAAAPGHMGGFVLNPALLGFCGLRRRASRFLMGITVDTRRATTRRLDDPLEDTAEAEVDPRALLHVAVASRPGLLGFTLGAWYREKAGARARFPGRDPAAPLVPSRWDRQRYGALAYRLRLHHFGLAIGWRWRRWLGLGAAFGAQWLSLSHRRILATGTAGLEEEPRADFESRLGLEARFVPLGVIGALLRPLAWLRLGAAFELSSVAHPKGSAVLRGARPDAWGEAVAGKVAATMRVRMGWTARVGVGVDLGRVSVDVGGSLTGGSGSSPLTARSPGLLIRPTTWEERVVEVNELPTGIVLRRRRLALSIALRVALLPGRLHLSVGYGYTQGATEPALRSAALVEPDRHVLALGLGLLRGPLRVEVSYLHVEGISAMGSGMARQAHLLDPTAGGSITSGRQSLRGELLGVTLSVDLDPAP